MPNMVATNANPALAAEPIEFDEASVSEQDSLLRTKLFIPPTHPHNIRRSALVEHLMNLGHIKLILITAPAGFGKTTFISQWLADRQPSHLGNRTAWLSLEEADNNLGRFWKYFIAAIQMIDPCAGLSLASVLSRPTLPPPETWLPVLLHDLEKIPVRVTLVLDDYQFIRTRTIHQSLNHLIQHLPPHIRLVIITRADPPLPLARLRLQGDVAEIRAADLLFSPYEIEEYLNDKLQLSLSAEDLRLLAQRTEGWPAGIQLAARSLLDRVDEVARHHSIRQFSGSNENVLNYLLEEVLQRQQPMVRDFLLQTSILSRLTAPLCAVVAGTTTEKAENILVGLSHEHLFTSPLDEDGQWYRYHPLLSEALAAKLREGHPQRWQDGHCCALNWLVAHDHHELAIQHALAVCQYDKAVEIIDLIGDETWAAGDISSPLGWLSSLPKAHLQKHKSLFLMYAWLLVLNERLDEADALWREAGDVNEPNLDAFTSTTSGRWAIVGGALAHLREQPEEALRLSKQALQRLPPEDRLWRIVSQLICGRAYQGLGQAAPAIAIYQEMIDLCAVQGIPYLCLLAQASMIEALHTQGRLYEAQARCERMRTLIGEPAAVEDASLDSHACVCIGRLYYERNELGLAEHHITEGIERIWPDGQAQQAIAGHLLLARIKQLKGSREESRRQMEAALDIAIRLRLANEERAVRATIARLALYDGEWDLVKCWQAGSGVSPNDLADYRREYEHRVLAEVLIAQGQFTHAEALLSRCRAAAARGGRAGSDLPLALLYAVALARQNRLPEADAVLRGVLPLSESQDFIRTYLDIGAPIIDLMRRPAVRSHAPVYIDRLCALHDWENVSNGANIHPPRPTNGHQTHPITMGGHMVEVDSLTPREAEILSLIARGSSNQEIADCLVLSVGTVKGHINHIFNKLDVHSRTAAVARARDYSLLKN